MSEHWSKTHGMCNTAVYAVYHSMKNRAHDIKFHRYAGRGITVCKGWRESFEVFISDMGMPPTGYSLERIDNDGGYWCGHCEECTANGWPANCEWATPKKQSNNRGNNRKITADGLTLTLSEWADRTGISQSGIRIRLQSGWPEEEAVLVPVLSKQERMRRLQNGHQAWRSTQQETITK